MTRALIGAGLVALLTAVAMGQQTPKFEAADVHAGAPTVLTGMLASSRGRRYELRNATLLDLVRTAYTVNADDVVGGPTWIEYNKFDVFALVPPNTPPETQKLMLQSLLADRFKLTVRRDTRPATGLVLTPGKGKHKLKEAADSAAPPGCQIQPQQPARPTPGQITLPVTDVVCHGVTMEKFASELKRVATGYVPNAVVDQTGLKDAWDFEFKYTQFALLNLASQMNASVTSLADAIDQQLGLKLEEQKIPTPVVLVEQASFPSPNPPDVAAKLPPAPPLEFEVADIKPIDPAAPRTGGGPAGVLPGGRVVLPGIPLKLVISLAWNMPTNLLDQYAGAPKWVDTANFDIIAKLPPEAAPANGATVPLQELGPALQALLIDRFKMKAHFEDRPVDAYTLVAVKPKLKKSDPSSRTGCKAAANSNGAVIINGGGLPPRTFNCQNITMAQFADQLRVLAASYTSYPVVDATKLEGAWDFTISFSPISPAQLAGLTAGRGAPPPGPGAGGGPGGITASDPIGGAMSLLDAVDRQLGLKLEVQKRTYPVFVIDHIDEKPTEN